MRPTGNSTSEPPVSPSTTTPSPMPTRMPDDAELVRRIGHGDESAFRELVNRHSRYLFGIAHSMSGNAADAEDLVQETFVAVLNSKFRGESAVRTWLVQILVRRAAMLRRSRKRRSTWVPRDASTDQTAVAPRSSGTAGAEARLDLAVMLERLSPEHRQVIVLREIEQMSYEEMAAALGVPRGTIESRLHRARADLRERFKGYLKS
jgi:RNA polymerase sigma-70 factor (ECF subfamily)